MAPTASAVSGAGRRKFDKSVTKVQADLKKRAQRDPKVCLKYFMIIKKVYTKGCHAQKKIFIKFVTSK